MIGAEASAAASAADVAVANGDELGPLHGVPISVKENIDIAGFPTTQGVTAFAELVAPTDAPVVERMRAAGAYPFVRTNMPDFGLRVHTDSSLPGLTREPWRSVTAGGSSGGEGSALASDMSPLGLGNDIGGSLRNPAHCNGITSIKPTTGVIQRRSAAQPTVPGRRSRRSGRRCRPTCGLPAAVVPAAVVDGLPVGAQFIAARFRDLTALAAAQAVEDLVGVFTPIAPVPATMNEA